MLSMLLLDNEEVTLFSFMVAGRHIGGFSEVCVFDVVLHSVICAGIECKRLEVEGIARTDCKEGRRQSVQHSPAESPEMTKAVHLCFDLKFTYILQFKCSLAVIRHAGSFQCTRYT